MRARTRAPPNVSRNTRSGDAIRRLAWFKRVRRGACDPIYNFSVNITNGIVTHPNLVKFHGYVVRSGAVRASVTVQHKFASGSGKLTGNSGRGVFGCAKFLVMPN